MKIEKQQHQQEVEVEVELEAEVVVVEQGLIVALLKFLLQKQKELWISS